MRYFLIGCAAYAALCLFVWSLCRAAADGDRALHWEWQR